MRIVIPGGSGQVGTMLARHFHARGDDVVVLSRNPMQAPWKSLAWDARTIGTWADAIDAADVVINLAGRNVNCRYNAANRKAIMDSRVDSTRIVGEAIRKAKNPPHVWLQASTATIYAHTYGAPNDDKTGVIGGNEPDAPSSWRFSIEVARAWERALDEADTPSTRKVAMRAAITLSPDRGGIFDVLLGLVRRGLGGKCGDGKQFISWVHQADFIRSVEWLINRDTLSGPVNICAPNPETNADFMRILREAWGTKIGLPASRLMLEVGAVFLRTETELILKSRRVFPRRLTEDGFQFAFSDWATAARDLCQRWRAARGQKQIA